MKCLFISVAILFWVGCQNLWAGEQTFKSVLDKRITFFGGAQFYQAEGEFSSTKDGRPDIEIDLDDVDLNENEVSPILGAVIHFGRRWALRLDYFGYHEDSTTTAEFGFNFDDLVVPVGARVDTNLDLDVYVINLAYNFIRTDRARFGVGLGAHVADIDLEVTARVRVAGNDISLGEGEADLLAPLPNLYAAGGYAITERLLLRYGGGWMSLSYGDYDGSLVFASAFVEYWPFRNAGFGIGYRYVTADIDYDPGHKEENYDVDLPGPVLYLTVGF